MVEPVGPLHCRGQVMYLTLQGYRLEMAECQSNHTGRNQTPNPAMQNCPFARGRSFAATFAGWKKLFSGCRPPSSRNSETRYNRGMPTSFVNRQLRTRSARAERIRSTTVLCVRRDNRVVMVGDGQVTVGEHVMKHSAKKIRRLFEDKVLAGFAGSTADAFSLFGRFENK